MPKDFIDYSNTIIYLIYCKLPNISETYVGHTTNFSKRKYYHKTNCVYDDSIYIYDIIRKTGGWNNWEMIEIAKYNCSSSIGAKQKEQYHNDLLKSHNPYKNQYFTCGLKMYNCQCCNYSTDRKSSYTKHLITDKHKKVAMETQKLHFETEKLQIVANLSHNTILQCDICNKEFVHRSGLWKHRKICQSNERSGTLITPELVVELIQDNKEMKQIILEQHHTINNLVKNGITTINANTNCMNNNKTFNLQFFLNETCKDAMNINEFVESIKIQLCDLERFGEIGYVENLSNIITTNLKALDVTERPVHCTDKKRETIYIKDDDKWEKEDVNNSKLRKVIKKVASKNYKLLPQYREKYPGC